MLKDILSISGHGGLFRYLKKSRNGIIVENLETKKRLNVDATARINALEDISIYTLEDDIPLKDVFKSIYEQEDGGAAPKPKKASADDLKSYFGDILPDYDEDRVYVSDIKKILTWYNVLHKLDLLNFEEEETEEEDASGQESASEEQKDQPDSDNTEE